MLQRFQPFNFAMSGWLRYSDTFIALDRAQLHFSTPSSSFADEHWMKSYDSSNSAEQDARGVFPSLKFFNTYSLESHKQEFKIPNQYARESIRTQKSISHMYMLQEIIIAKVTSEYEYIVKTREDIYFFKPIPPDWRPEPSCDVTAKSCLSWGGINMRLQWYKFNVAKKIMSTRFKDSWNINQGAVNPEEFEMLQLQLHGYTSCTAHQDIFSIAAVRYLSSNKRCFNAMELGFGDDGCIPTGCVAGACQHNVFELNTTLCGTHPQTQVTHQATPSPSATRNAKCYASRYPDLARAYCGGGRDLVHCDIPGLLHHFHEFGQQEGRRFRCHKDVRN
jgi:hypothetical protein